jgi:hypothetical protein
MRGGEADPGATPGRDDVVLGAAALDLDRADPADALPPLSVLEMLDFSSVLALGHEGTEQVDWAARVRDRSGLCPECGRPDGPQHHRKCLAHPPGTSVWGVVLTCLLVPMPLMLVAGPYALGFFLPTILLALYIRSR